ncbi:MAG: 3'-5' exonuclease [Rhodobacteraceae bacterium]|nr:3'-5' exonuclease [Paracoccaceae bacterium]
MSEDRNLNLGNALVFDFETNDKPPPNPKKGKPPIAADSDEWVRAASLCAKLYDPTGRLLDEMHQLIEPRGWEMDPEAMMVNKLTMARLAAEGLPIKKVLKEFRALERHAGYHVCFNVRFDTKVLRGERRRAGKKDRYGQYPSWDAMRGQWMILKDRSPTGKAPFFKSLGDAYLEIFGEEMPGAHTADGDVDATARVLRECLDRGLVELKQYSVD